LLEQQFGFAVYAALMVGRLIMKRVSFRIQC